MNITPLEAWIKKKVGCQHLSRKTIREYQLQRLQETLALVTEKSIFYRQKLAGYQQLTSLTDLAQLPLTTELDLQKNPYDFLCLPLGEIKRIVSLQSSGTTGKRKRIFFTAVDQELTIDFFHHGMSTLVSPGDRILIMLPGARPGSVGYLLQKALHRFGVTSIICETVGDLAATYRTLITEKINALVGAPVQVLALARYSEKVGPPHFKSVLLSTDYVPQVIRRELKRIWHCQVFSHYGTTEMGLGGGVECSALAGHHVRETDLLFEIIDPVTHNTVPPGQMGEVVFTTLTRIGMPLIRYATGDIARVLPEKCACGSILLRLEHIQGRRKNIIKLEAGNQLALHHLDEKLFAIPSLVDFTASISMAANKNVLQVVVSILPGDTGISHTAIEDIIISIPQVKRAVQQGILTLAPVTLAPINFTNKRMNKRILLDLRPRRETD